MRMARNWVNVLLPLLLCQLTDAAAEIGRHPSSAIGSRYNLNRNRSLGDRWGDFPFRHSSLRRPSSIQRPAISNKRTPFSRSRRNLTRSVLSKQAFGPDLKNLTMVSDGDGGALYFWSARLGADYAILGQRVDALGSKQWNNGLPQVVSIGEIVDQENPVAASDGAGGAFLFFAGEYTSGEFAGHVDIFGQHVSRIGTALWNDGFPLEIMATDQIERNPVVVLDGEGGVIVAAELEFVSGDFEGHIDIFGQRIDQDGNLLWNDGGPSSLIATDEKERNLAATGDGKGGIILATELEFDKGEFAGQIDIFAQRLDGDGNALWNDGDPISVIGTDFPERRPIVVADGDGGAVVVSEFEFTSDMDVVAQRVDSDGNLLWNDGDLVGVTTTEQDERNPSVVPDGSGGIKVAVELEFTTGEAKGHIDIFGQWVDGQGSLQWNQGDPLEIMITDEAERVPLAVSDGLGGILVAAQLEFVTPEFMGHIDIFGQRVSASGSLMWNLGHPVSLMGSETREGAPHGVTDMDGGMILGVGVGLLPPNVFGEDADLHGQRIDGGGNILWAGDSEAAVVIAFDSGFRDLVGLTVVEVDLETGLIQLDSPEGERIQTEVGIATSVVDLDGEPLDLESVTVGSTVNVFGLLFEGVIGVFTLEVVDIALLDASDDKPAVELTVFPQDGSGEWSLDLDAATGDQGVRELNGFSAGDEFTLELVTNQNVSPALGGSFTIQFDPEQLEPITSSISGIAAQLGVAVVDGSEVRFTLAGVAGVPVEEGHIGEIRFTALGGFEGETEIKLVKAAIGDATSFANVESEPNATVVIRSIGASSSPNPDFDGDGVISFRDFILFAQKFGARSGEQVYDAQYDLDSSGDIGFRDFILFAQVYGKPASEFVAL